MLASSLERIRADIEALAAFNETPGQGCTRFSYGAADKMARNFLLERFAGMGLKVSVDSVGNIRARRDGSMRNAPVVMTGSHIDTVLHGGRFDGVTGVVCAMEATRILAENGIETRYPIEIVVFVEEEGSNFGATMTGSKVMTGRIGLPEIKKLISEDGRSMYRMARDAGFDPDSLQKSTMKPGEIKAMIEVHIEQGAVLDLEHVPIGIVGSIYGSKSLRVEFRGVPNHAGATPMRLRHDPLVAAAAVIAGIPDIVERQAFGSTVATVGKISCHPNIINCIPGTVSFTIDIRDVRPEGIEITVRGVERLIEAMVNHHGVEVSVERLAESSPIELSPEVIGVIERSALERGVSFARIDSGAVHDSAMLAGITKVGMIFVPSRGGRSHVPEESTDFEDIRQGCDVLLGAILALAG